MLTFAVAPTFAIVAGLGVSATCTRGVGVAVCATAGKLATNNSPAAAAIHVFLVICLDDCSTASTPLGENAACFATCTAEVKVEKLGVSSEGITEPARALRLPKTRTRRVCCILAACIRLHIIAKPRSTTGGNPSRPPQHPRN